MSCVFYWMVLYVYSHTLHTSLAQVAANQKGILLVQELISEFGLDVVQAYMKHIQSNAEGRHYCIDYIYCI